MATRFTRVTIVGDDRQVDVSLPAAAPVAEQLPIVLRLLSIEPSPAPRRWVLSTPEAGTLPRDRSLDECGVLDGMVLHLTEAPQAAAPPFVDDVEATAAEQVEQFAPPFAQGHRRSGIAGLLGLLLLLGCWLTTSAPNPVGWVAAAVIGLVALVIGALVDEPGGGWAAAVAVPAAAAVVYAVDDRADGLTAADWMLIAVAAALASVAVGLLRQTSSATAGGIVATVLAAGSWICLYAGVPAYRTAGLVVLVSVVCAGIAGQLALGGAGLVNLLVADERGEKVPRQAVASSVRRGEAIATGVVTAAAGGAAVSLVVLFRTVSPGSLGWVPPAFGAVGSIVFALRSRMFSRARQVVPMLAVTVVGAVAAATMVPVWLSMSAATAAAAVAFALLAVVAVVLAATGFATVSEVAGARLRRLYELGEFVTVLALVPGLILLFDAITAMRRWLG